MTLLGIGTTEGAQSANNVVAAVATAAGTISFTGPSGIQGSTITCVVTVPAAGPGAFFMATLGTINGQGVTLESWNGQSTVGRFQVGVGQTLVVGGTGLIPGTQYTCTFSMIIDVGEVEVVIPDPNSSGLATVLAGAGLAGAAGGVRSAFGTATAGASYTPALPTQFRLWGWGLTIFNAFTDPTSGASGLNFTNPTTGFQIWDALAISEVASVRLAGLVCANGGLVIFNETNETLPYFVNFSLS